MEPGGLLLYNGRLNERHDFLAVEIIQGQVQLKYSTGRLGTTYCGIWAMGAAEGGFLLLSVTLSFTSCLATG